MFYFRLNTDNYNSPNHSDDKTDIGEITVQFIRMLDRDLTSYKVEWASVFNEEIGVPVDAFSIKNETDDDCEKLIQLIVSEYSKKPLVEFGNVSLEDMGITVELCKKISSSKVNEIISQYMEDNNATYITEEVLHKYLLNDEKIDYFSRYLKNISSEGKELIIVDPYLFYEKSNDDENNDYCNILAEVIKKSKASHVIAITSERNYSESIYTRVSECAEINIVVKYSNDFHDRFWISDRKKGFNVGTSFNGVGKKISLINMLSENDLNEIVEELSEYLNN